MGRGGGQWRAKGRDGKKIDNATRCNSCGKRGHIARNCHRKAWWKDENTRLYEGDRHVIGVGYIGTHYHGNSWEGGNPNVGSVESTIVLKMNEIGMVPVLPGPGQSSTVAINRASRTDAGVHACRNMFSISLAPGSAKRMDELRAVLPKDIQIQTVQTVKNMFDFRSDCLRRVYYYHIPYWAFNPRLVKEEPSTPMPSEEDDMVELEADEEYKELAARVNEVLGQIQGSHCFHNFTDLKRNAITPDSDEALRRLPRVECGAAPVGVGAKKFLRVELEGVSFILNQIRKIIGLTLAIVRGNCRATMVEDALSPEKWVDVPLAPGFPLCLWEQKFTNYNQMIVKEGSHPPIEGVVQPQSSGMLQLILKEIARMGEEGWAGFLAGMRVHNWCIRKFTSKRKRKRPLPSEEEEEGKEGSAPTGDTGTDAKEGVPAQPGGPSSLAVDEGEPPEKKPRPN